MQKSEKRNKLLFAWITVLPALILFVIIMIIPTIEVFRMSLFRTSSFSQNAEFIGLDNFRILLQDELFLRSIQNTIFILVIVPVITIGIALFLSYVVTSRKVKGAKVSQFIIYIPNVLSVVVIAGIFSAIYGYQDGLLNTMLDFLSLSNLKQMWLSDHRIVLYSIAFAMVWQQLGYYMVLYSTSMSSIPEDLYEAADIEGATPMYKFTKITIPLIWGNIRNTLTFLVTGAVNLSFTLVIAMTEGGPNGASEVALSYMYKQSYTNSAQGYGMAIGVVVFVFTFVLSYALNKVSEREVVKY